MDLRPIVDRGLVLGLNHSDLGRARRGRHGNGRGSRVTLSSEIPSILPSAWLPFATASIYEASLPLDVDRQDVKVCLTSTLFGGGFLGGQSHLGTVIPPLVHAPTENDQEAENCNWFSIGGRTGAT